MSRPQVPIPVPVPVTKFEPMLDYCGTLLERPGSLAKRIVVLGHMIKQPHPNMTEYYTTAIMIPLVQPLTHSKIVLVPTTMVDKSNTCDKISTDILINIICTTLHNNLGYPRCQNVEEKLKYLGDITDHIISFVDMLIRKNKNYQDAIVHSKHLFSQYRFLWLDTLADKLMEELSWHAYYYQQMTKVKKQWRQAISDPQYALCRKRLLREYCDMVSEATMTNTIC